MTFRELVTTVGIHGDAAYMAKLRQLSNATDRLGASTNSAGDSMAGSWGKVASAATAAGSAVLGFGGAALSAMVGIGTLGVQAAAEWEQLQVTLEVLTGSAEKAKQKLSFIRELAIPATATTQELARAGLQLEAFGVRLEKALPLAAKLQAAFSMDPQALEKAVSLMGRLAQGDFPDIELLSGLGLSKQQFRQQGVEFDSQGRMLSSARKSMDALAAIVESKYGNILDRVSNTTASKLATVNDRWQEVLRQLGQGIQKTLLPVLELLAGHLDDLAKSGAVFTWGENMLKVSGMVVMVMGAVLAGILAVNTAMAALSGNVVAALGFAAAHIAVLVGTSMAAGWIAGQAKRLAALGRQASKGAPVPADANPEQGWGSAAAAASATQLEKIARATQQTADNTRPDIRRMALGGGALGKLGVTPAEFGVLRRAGGERMVLEVKGDGGTILERWITALIRDGQLQVMRQARQGGV